MDTLPLLYILYDGIDNSVFDGQVLQPLLNKIKSNLHKKICLISFEHYSLTQDQLKQKIPYHERLHVIICKKYSYIGSINLRLAAYQLKKKITLSDPYECIARGPLAALIAHYIRNAQCQSLIIQARGLLAQEYLYAQSNACPFLLHALLIRCRSWQLYAIEKKAYMLTHTSNNTRIETVSNALKEYLIDQFGIQADRITLAHEDIPTPFAPAQITQWYEQTRKELNIQNTTHMYCYNGSIKPWQCPQMVLTYFTQELKKNDDIFLLILTQDVTQFQALISAHSFDEKYYAIMKVTHTDIYRYLAACNTGLLFREPHIVNWISRPTKALEYNAVGIPIVHNNTIHYLHTLINTCSNQPGK